MAKVEILFPQMGESIVEGTVTKWLKKPGDKVEKDETILEISTDKVDSEVPSSHAGILVKILVPEGSRAEVGNPVGIIETDASQAKVEEDGDEGDKAEKADDKVSSDQSKEPPSKKQPEKPSETKKQSSVSASNRFYSPLVKRLAKENNVDLSQLDDVPGSGSGNRLTKDDFQKWLSEGGSKSASSGAALRGGALTGSVSATTKKRVEEGKARLESMDQMRKVIAERMWDSVHTSPHVTSFHEVDVTAMVKYREAQKKPFMKKYDFNLTYTMLIAEAAVKALREFPYLNASVEGQQIVLHQSINLGMAVSVEPLGLMVPVIHEADEKNLVGIAKSLHDLANRARVKKVTPDELSGSTFSITNLGSFGSLTGTPIINQPNVAILGLGAITKKPVVVTTDDGDSIAIRSMMILSLAYDHRLVDGALGGKYLARLAELLTQYEGPDFR